MPRTSHAVILIEFNELTPKLMEQFIRLGHLPNFKRQGAGSVAVVCFSNGDGIEVFDQ